MTDGLQLNPGIRDASGQCHLDPEQGGIVVRVEELEADPGGLCPAFSVSDTGIGIEEAAAARISDALSGWKQIRHPAAAVQGWAFPFPAAWCR